MTASPTHRDATDLQKSPSGSTTLRRRATTTLPSLIDTAELSEILGVGERHVRRLVDERRIPFVKVGRYVRFDVEEVKAWIDANRVRQFRPALQRGVGR